MFSIKDHGNISLMKRKWLKSQAKGVYWQVFEMIWYVGIKLLMDRKYSVGW